MMYLWYTLKFDIVGINITKELNLLYSIARVLHHVCLQPQSYYTFWRLQQVNQFNWELPPPPQRPQQAYSTECLL